MSKKIHTIQSSDKVEFIEQVNQFLDLGCELMDGGFEVINNDDDVVYSQVIVFKNCDVDFTEDGQLLYIHYKNEDGEYDGLYIDWWGDWKLIEGTYKDGKGDGVKTWWDKNGQKANEITFKDGEIILIGKDRIAVDYN